MFEKEAEEYVMREDVSTENDRVPFDNGYGFQTVSFEDEVKKAFKDGAEFGYNKCKEELNQKGLALQSDMDKTIEQNIALKKENAELKEENTELKTKKIPQLERKITSIRGCHSVAVKKLNARIEQVERLKKENAELRQKLRSKL